MNSLLVVLYLILGSAFANDSIVIEHSFDGHLYHTRSEHPIQRNNEKFIVSDIETDSFLNEFKSLINSNGLYHVRAKLINGGVIASASLPACELQKSGFREDIVLHVRSTHAEESDVSKSSNVLGLSYTSPLLALPRPCDASKLTSFPRFQTKVHTSSNKVITSIPSTVQGPRPPLFQHITVGDETDTALKSAQQNAEQSFLRKYWYIVLPMVVFVMFGGGGAEEEKKAGAAGAPAKAAPNA